MIVWVVPTVLDGETWYQCRLDSFGHKVQAYSRTKAGAVAHALEALAAAVRNAGEAEL